MNTFSGVGVSPGRVTGPVKQMPPTVLEPPAGQTLAPGTSAEHAVETLKTAASAVQAELRERADRATGDAKEILQATALMAADPALIKSSTKLIGTGLSAERAVWEAAEEVAAMLRQLGGYMAERVHDVFDVRARLVAQLRGLPAPGVPAGTEPFILIAEELAPADTATLDPALVLALATSEGGPQSHTAIIARALGLPAVVAAPGVTGIVEGTEVFLDGAEGTLSIEPSAEQRAAAQSWAAKSATRGNFDGRGILADGHLLPLLANVGNAKEAVLAAAAGAEGVGLFRTEFLFLNRDSEPSMEEQVEAYRGVFQAFSVPGEPRKVVVRTLDAGADKPLPFLSNAAEPNPALGLRGYRTGLNNPGVLKRQLEAISTAAVGTAAEVWVMAPMISTPAESADFADLCRAAGLRSSGVMIEVPAAAISAAKIFQHVDFASLGTNDLTQYTMAADRQLGLLSGLNDPWQPSVLKLIAGCAEAAQAAAKPLGVCGEAAADPALAVVLAGLGVSTLSMTARALPAVAAVLKTVSLKRARELAVLALAEASAEDARTAVRGGLPALHELGL